MLRLVRLITICIVTMILVLCFQLRTQAVYQQPLQSYKSAGAPSVTVGLHISNLTEVNTVEETWSFTGFLISEFNYTDLNVFQKDYDLSTQWHPGLEIVNVKEYELLGQSAEIVKGVVKTQEKFRVTLSSDMNINRFPFDSQSLEIAIEASQNPSIVLRSMQPSISDDKFVGLEEWMILGQTVSSSKSYFPPEQVYYPRISFHLNVKRRPSFFVQKIMLPIGTITLVSIIVLFLDTETQFPTQLGAAMTAALSSLTLWLLSAEVLPKSVDPSILDLFVRNSLSFNGLSIFCSIYLYIVHSKSLKTSVKPSYVATITIILYILSSWVIVAF